MKTLSPDLTARLDGEVTTLATCWKLTRRDGVIQGFTDHDQPVTVGGLTYEAATGFTPTAIASTADLAVDNLDVEGMLDSGTIAEADLLAGRYDYAAVSIFMVDYLSPGAGTLPLKEGWLGEVTLADGRFVAEMRGLTQRLNQHIGEIYSPTCRASFGDARCKLDLTARRVTGHLTAVTSRQVVKDASRGDAAAGRFAFGLLQCTSGANQGITREVKSFAVGMFTLNLPFPFDPAPGDAYTATEGCDKSFLTCGTRFNNAVNFRGEPHMPGLDRMLETATTRSHS